jgi:hypothetical protein
LHIEEKSVDGLTKLLSQQNNDTIKKILQQTDKIEKIKQAQTTDSIPKKVADFGYKSINELDSIQKHGGKKGKAIPNIGS